MAPPSCPPFPEILLPYVGGSQRKRVKEEGLLFPKFLPPIFFILVVRPVAVASPHLVADFADIPASKPG